MSLFQAARMAVGAAKVAKNAANYVKTQNTAKHNAQEHPVPAGYEHLMAFGTILYEKYGQTSLAATGQDQDTVRASLASSWNITDYNGAAQTLAWLRDGGHRVEYGPYVAAALYDQTKDASAAPPPKVSFADSLKNAYGSKESKAAFQQEYWQQYIAGLPGYVQAFYNTVPDAKDIVNCVATIRYALKHCSELPVEVFNATQNVDAWDIERIGIVVRLSFESGYLAEGEAYQWLGVAEQMARASYRSWQQYCAAWLLGRAFWCKDASMFVNEQAVTSIDHVREELRKNTVWQTYPLG